MELPLFLNNLRDPMGLPFYGVVFQVLMVLTFALHIFFVNIVVGSLLLSLLGRFSTAEYMQRLARTLAKVATISLSIAVVLGVAPLLFVQVIYDPFWYSANLLSAWWAMLFLLLVMLGFLAAYGSYLLDKKRPGSIRLAGLVSFAMILAGGAIIHMLNMESLMPQMWGEWYAAGDQLATSGWAFNAFSVSRFGHFIVPSAINAGIFLMLYSWYLSGKNGANSDYFDWVATLGGKITRGGLIVQAGFGLWWLFAIPGNLNFLVNPGFHLGATIAVIAIATLFWATAKPQRRAPVAALISFVAILAMCISREALRMAYVGVYDYSIYNYPVRVDWGSTILFFATFVAGLVVMSYPLLVAFKAGRGEEV